MSKVSENCIALIAIMDELREKCPWDKKQTLDSLKKMTIEETYELADAIERKDWKNLQEELGDLMLHILFYSKIASEENQFDLNAVFETLKEKLIKRHPHIYGNVEAKDAAEVKKNWEKIKQAERGEKKYLDGLPNSMPPILKAERIQEKARHIGFDWQNKMDVWKKLEEELGELKTEIIAENRAEIEAELGDVVFSLINLSRFLGIDIQKALETTNQKFINRFEKMETLAAKNNEKITNLSLETLENLWQAAKKTTF